MKTVIVIPARYDSKRFPGKPLIRISGRPLIQHVWEQACESRFGERVIVATDDERIRDAVAACGGEVLMTETGFRTGTDRLAWVADRVPADAYLNLQGDEFIQDARILDDLIAHFKTAQPVDIYPASKASGRGRRLSYSANSSSLLRAAGEPQLDPASPVSEDQASPVRARGVGASEERQHRTGPQIRSGATRAPTIGTLKQLITGTADENDPNVVKVVTDRDGYALYFSRAAIPFQRDRETGLDPGKVSAYKHLGIYIYRKDALVTFAQLPTGILEGYEKLEQLRALEHGIRIKVWETSYESIRIDTEEDARRAERFLTKRRPRRS